MQPFDYVIPQTHVEASRLLLSHDGAARPLLGGTDLLVRIRGGFVQPATVVDLKRLPGMREIRIAADGGLSIGAGCTLNQIARHPEVCERFDLLAQACRSVASYQLRNRATIGGNCCNASPAADTAPALYCLDAVAEIYGPGGVRCVPIAEFFMGPGRSALQHGEFLTALILPPAAKDGAGVFRKLGRTRLGDISTVNVAVYAWDGARVWRITMGAVGPTPLRAPQAEAVLAQDRSPAAIVTAAQLAAQAAQPIDDIRASAAYRRAMVAVLTRRSVEAVLAGCGGGA